MTNLQSGLHWSDFCGNIKMVMRITVIKISLIFLFALDPHRMQEELYCQRQAGYSFPDGIYKLCMGIISIRDFLLTMKEICLLYDNPEEWNFPDNGSVISQDKLFENLSKCTISERIIPREELQKFSKHIQNIASSKVSAPKNAGADMGSITYICYQFDEGSRTYKGFLIKMEGDITCENLNFFSKKVASWMKEINDNISIEIDHLPAIHPIYFSSLSVCIFIYNSHCILFLIICADFLNFTSKRIIFRKSNKIYIL